MSVLHVGSVRPPVVLPLPGRPPLYLVVLPGQALLGSLCGEGRGVVEWQLCHLDVSLVSDWCGLPVVSDLQVLGEGARLQRLLVERLLVALPERDVVSATISICINVLWKIFMW